MKTEIYISKNMRGFGHRRFACVLLMSTNDWLIGTFSFYIATRNTCNGQICPITDYQSDYW